MKSITAAAFLTTCTILTASAAAVDPEDVAAVLNTESGCRCNDGIGLDVPCPPNPGPPPDGFPLPDDFNNPEAWWKAVKDWKEDADADEAQWWADFLAYVEVRDLYSPVPKFKGPTIAFTGEPEGKVIIPRLWPDAAIHNVGPNTTMQDILDAIQAAHDGEPLNVLFDGHGSPGSFVFTAQAPAKGDLNGDGVVDVLDLLILLDLWGPCPHPCEADLNGDGEVDVLDLLQLLDSWGDAPPVTVPVLPINNGGGTANKDALAKGVNDKIKTLTFMSCSTGAVGPDGQDLIEKLGNATNTTIRAYTGIVLAVWNPKEPSEHDGYETKGEERVFTPKTEDDCGHPEAGDCFEPNGTPYCDDEKCCLLICGFDAFCCDVEWDIFCAKQAFKLCEHR